ncbi:uncharacterized protein PFL1_04548 [Pseudozyma flocculosa PF-1]|uniref:Uncharacterized protein n=2 Tax=Pseudozyma flocculosa TaxID=84751 RepID=A0A5C3FCD5_9BASI|nr:uncharacterized protein PFL1_04548 [Pseudozyma flocculosa PF-1]EPQ27803.1 hypothetical protein PFL1_04548 [Pseudozyma flocculosa PF-1]SPO41069.1 uncharacterized protein PSFLO_06551 [Pseudozyma flocculosa]
MSQHALPSSSRQHPEADRKVHHRLRGSLGKSHFAIDPHALALPPNSPTGLAATKRTVPSKSSATRSEECIFDEVPRNGSFGALLPILSRLPRDLAARDDIEQVEEETEDFSGTDSALDYLQGRTVPYTRSHLPQIDEASLALWQSLHHFRPLTADYASGYIDEAVTKKRRSATDASLLPPHPISPSFDGLDISHCPAFTASDAAITTIRRVFNWQLLPALPLSISGEWYGVVFRSVRRAGSESTSFYEADRLAHEEAVRSGGLLMYWYGAPDPKTGENLATCIWTNRRDAIRASRLELHGKAARLARDAYDVYDLTRYTVRKKAGEEKLSVEEWRDGER